MAGQGTPGTPPAGGAPAPSPTPPTPPATPPASPAAPPSPPEPPAETITLTSEQLKERLERTKKQALAEAGFDPTEYERNRQELATLKKEAEDRKKAEMSAIERAELESKEAVSKMVAAEAEAKAAKDEARVTRICASLGIKDVGYAQYRIAHLEADTDIHEWLKEKLEDPTEQARFGIADVAPVQPKTTTTTDPTKGPPSPPTPGGGGPEKPVDEMTREEYQRYKRDKHGL